MDAPSYRKLLTDGLWSNNVIFTQLLALCPLMAVTTTATNGLGMGLVTMVVLIASNVLVSMIRNWVPNSIRIPIFTLLIAALVTLVDQAMNAWLHGLYIVLGIFLPLIVTNCIIIARAEGFAARNDVGRAAFDGLMMGAGFALVLVALGVMREVLGQGTIFANAHLMFGEWGRGLTLQVMPDNYGFLLAILPPGAFLALALLIAFKNALDLRQSA